MSMLYYNISRFVSQHAGGDEQDERRERAPKRGEENLRRQIAAAAAAVAERSNCGTSKANSHKVRDGGVVSCTSGRLIGFT